MGSEKKDDIGKNEPQEVAARRFEELFQGLPIACLGFDGKGMIIEFNRASEALFDCPAGLFLANLVGLFGGNSSLKAALISVAAGHEVAIDRIEIEIREQKTYLFVRIFPSRGANGQVTGGLLAAVDLTAQVEFERTIQQQKADLEDANARLASLASTDGLTGIQNHRAFQEGLVREIKRSQRSGKPLSLILLDVDNFKRYNDSYGHPAGDKVLQSVAQILVASARGSDVVARYGGEEFVIILPDTDADGAMICAERMRADIEGAAWPHRLVTASFGVSTLGKDETSAELIQHADKALYESKSAGRNRATHWRTIRKAA